MTKPDIISWAAIGNMVSFNSFYLLTWAFAYGAAIWVTVIGRTIAEQTFSKHEINSAKKKIGPKYFQAIFTSAIVLFLGWMFTHPEVLPVLFNFKYSAVIQQHVLLSVVLLQGFNSFLLGPAIDKSSSKRHSNEGDVRNTDRRDPIHTSTSLVHEKASDIRQELQEYGPSPSTWPKIALTANWTSIAALAFHGLWIANNGISQ